MLSMPMPARPTALSESAASMTSAVTGVPASRSIVRTVYCASDGLRLVRRYRFDGRINRIRHRRPCRTCITLVSETTN